TDHRHRAHLDQVFRRGHLANLDHGGGRCRRLEIIAPHFVDLIEVLHVANKNIDATDVVEAAAGLFDRGLYVLKDPARLRFDIANPGNGPIGAPRRHAGDEYEAAARLDHSRVRKMTARLAEFW